MHYLGNMTPGACKRVAKKRSYIPQAWLFYEVKKTRVEIQSNIWGIIIPLFSRSFFLFCY